MIQTLIQAFQEGGLDWTDNEIADAIWLASCIDSHSAQSFIADQLSKKIHLDYSMVSSIQQATDTPKFLQPTINLHLPAGKSEITKGANGGAHAVPFYVAGSTALPGKLALGRSLRPLLRRVPSRSISVLDEAATAEFSAERRIFFPVLRPDKERWLDLSVVIDEWETMAIWHDTVAEFVEFLQQIGAFRTVHTYRLSTEYQQTNTGNKREVVQLYRSNIGDHTQKRPCSPQELFSAPDHRLVLIASDCTAPIWSNGEIGRLLTDWGHSSIVALVQMLPTSLWAGSALANTSQVYLSAQVCGQPNCALTIETSWSLRHQSKSLGFVLPVFTLEPEAIGVWSNVLTGKAGVQVPGLYLLADSALTREPYVEPNNVRLTGEQLFQQFRATASPTARKLAGYLAAAPLSLPVMRLVQKLMLPHSRQVHLAEVFRSGLIAQVAKISGSDGLEEMSYDYIEDTRQLFLSTISPEEALTVTKRVSEFVSGNSEQVRRVHALLLDPTLPGDFILDDNSIPLASIVAQVLYRCGGRYSQLAKRLQSQIPDPFFAKFTYPSTYNPPKPSSKELYQLCASANQEDVSKGFNILGEALFLMLSNRLDRERYDEMFIQDCVQLVLERIWKILVLGEVPNGADTFMQWAMTSAVRFIIDRLRYKARHTTEELSYTIEETHGTISVNSENQILLDESRIELITSLLNHPALSDQAKTILIEGFVYEQTDSELAILLGTKQNNIRVIRHRAFEKLRHDPNFLSLLRERNT